MSDRTVELCEAFDRARAWDRAARDQRIAGDLDRLTRLTSSIAERSTTGELGRSTSIETG